DQYVRSRRDDLVRHKYERIEELVDKITNIARENDYKPLIWGLGTADGLARWKDYVGEMAKRYTEAKDTFDRNIHLFDSDLQSTLTEQLKNKLVPYFFPQFEERLSKGGDELEVTIAQVFCQETMHNIVSGTNDIRSAFQAQLRRLDNF